MSEGGREQKRRKKRGGRDWKIDRGCEYIKEREGERKMKTRDEKTMMRRSRSKIWN